MNIKQVESIDNVLFGTCDIHNVIFIKLTKNEYYIQKNRFGKTGIVDIYDLLDSFFPHSIKYILREKMESIKDNVYYRICGGDSDLDKYVIVMASPDPNNHKLVYISTDLGENECRSKKVIIEEITNEEAFLYKL